MRPMIVPPRPNSEPMPMNRPPSRARSTKVLNVFLLTTGKRYAGRVSSAKNAPGSLVVVTRVDVDAGDAFAAEHLQVAAVVLEGQAEVESVGAKLPHRVPLELPGRR